MSRTVNYTKDAAKVLAKIPINFRRVIVAKIDGYAANPSDFGNIVIQLTDSPDFRMRVGDYRVIFYLTDQSMEVVRIGHRRDVYK